jgi:hypothetical protein
MEQDGRAVDALAKPKEIGATALLDFILHFDVRTAEGARAALTSWRAAELSHVSPSRESMS